METKNVIGLTIVILLAALLIVAVYWVSKPKTTAGAASTGMSSEGFSSNEEMMEAHHGKKAANGGSVGECGSEAPTASHDSPVQGSGEKAEYGVTYDNAGYQELMGYAKSITLTDTQTTLIVGLDASIPCCGFKMLQATGNCECGHHQALYGLAKLLASKDYSQDQIQFEMNKWKKVFFPEGAGGNTGGC